MLCRGLLFSQRLTSNLLWYCVQVRGILEEYRIGRLKGGQTAKVGRGVALLHGTALPAAMGCSCLCCADLDFTKAVASGSTNSGAGYQHTQCSKTASFYPFTARCLTHTPTSRRGTPP